MKTLLMVLFFLYAKTTMANLATKEYAPKKLSVINFDTATDSDIQKLLGPPNEKSEKPQKTLYFYNLNGIDFDTTFCFKKNKLVYFYILNPEKKSMLADFKNAFSEKEIITALKNASAEIGHQKGRSFRVTNIQLGMEAEFSAGANNELKSLTFWRPGSPKP